MKLDGAIDVINQLSGARDVNLAIPSPILFPTMALSQAFELPAASYRYLQRRMLELLHATSRAAITLFYDYASPTKQQPSTVELIKLSIELIKNTSIYKLPMEIPHSRHRLLASSHTAERVRCLL